MFDAATVRRRDVVFSWRSFFRPAPARARWVASTAACEDPDARHIQAMVDSLFEPPHPEEYRFRPE